jgi:hypothetical protein
VPHDTSASRDLSITLVVPIGGGGAGGGSTAYSMKRDGPFCTPRPVDETRTALAEVLHALGDLLTRVQLAHRGGFLCDGADRLDWLQHWYSDLQEELRCLEPRQEPPAERPDRR